MTALPYVKELLPSPEVGLALQAVSDWPNVLLLDSSLHRSPLGRYSFLTADPYELWEQTEANAQPFEQVQALLPTYSTNAVPGLPPFQGGAAGWLSYELGQSFERLPRADWDFSRLPLAVIGLYDWTLAWDHEQGRCWFIGHGFPEETQSLRMNRAECQYRSLLKALSSPLAQRREEASQRQLIPAGMPFSPSNLMPGLMSNFTHEGYLIAVQKVIDYIAAGDIFQANLSQQLLFPAERSPVEYYLRLRQRNPAPFAGYFAHDDWAVLSSSPERFVKVEGGVASTRPIKGTRRRRRIPEADLFSRDELRESEKDRAENVMIVDLLRNDLSRVCAPGSIQVPELCQVEAYATVAHLVSEVRGRLTAGATFWDLLTATFPGGSITGAPKIRAMEIITELEQVSRGAYCGSLFYHGFDGHADSNLLIRTMTQRYGWLQLPAGGGIVSQSVPEQEYQETLHKVQGLLRALEPDLTEN